MAVSLPAEYPIKPPTFQLLTIPFHPNVRRSGELCYNLLKRDYRPELSLVGLVNGLRVLLEEPNLEDCVDADAAQVYREEGW